MRFAELSKEDRVFICEQIPIKEAKIYLQNHPKETSKIYKGMVKSLTKERIVDILASNEKQHFISDYVDEILKKELELIRIASNHLVDVGEMNQQEALAFTLSSSIFSSRVSIYLKLAEKDYSEAYCLLLQTYVSMLKERKDSPSEESDAEDNNERKDLEEKIAMLEAQKEEAQAKHIAEVQALATEGNRLKQELDQRTEELKGVKEKLSTTELQIAEQSRVIDAYRNPPMPPLRYEHRSLCRVDASGEKKWLIRLADYSGDTLMNFEPDLTRPRRFDNRDRWYTEDAPRVNGYIGVWDWNTYPLDYDLKKDGIECVFRPEIIPVEVIIIGGIGNIESLISALRTGVEAQQCAERTLFAVYNGAGKYSGVLCSTGDLTIIDDRLRLSKKTYSLPIYEFNRQNIIQAEERWVLRTINPGLERKTVTIIDPLEIVKDCLLERMTNKSARTHQITRKELRSIREYVDSIKTEDYYRTIMEACGCSLAEAQSYTEQFLESVNKHIHLEDVDSNLLAFIAMNHPELRQKCMELLTQQWEEENRESILRKEEERTSVINEISALKTDRVELASEIEHFRRELASADEQIRERKQLAEDVEKKVEERIAAAKKNAADFICEMAFSAPRIPLEHKEETSASTAVSGLVRGGTLDEEPECLENWRNTLNSINDNLEDIGVGSQYRMGLSAFLYSCYLHHFPVLLAGPNGREIADALSAVLTGRLADYVDCSESQYRDVLPQIESLEDSVLVCDHPFVTEWVGHLPEFSRKQNVFTVFVHPYKEDLAVEPGGIVNYMLPLLTEFFVDQAPTRDVTMCRRTEGYREYALQKPGRDHQKQLSRLPFSTLARNKLHRVLTDMRSMCESQNDDYAFVLGLAPLAFLSDRTDQLVEMLDKKKLILSSDSIRKDIIGMLGNEE